MYHSLARGYATQFIEQQVDHGKVEDWETNGRSRGALRALEDFCRAKKPGRVINRVSKHTSPEFRRLRVSEWGKTKKRLGAVAISSAREAAVFSVNDANKHLYNERSVIVSQMEMISDEECLRSLVHPQVSVSHHALTRLFERGIATDKTIGQHVRVITTLSRLLEASIDDFDMPADNSFMIPYLDGALPIVVMDLVPNKEKSSFKNRIVSIRTFLDATMITEDHDKRMSNFYEVMSDIQNPRKNSSRLEWLKNNARPFDLSMKTNEIS